MGSRQSDWFVPRLRLRSRPPRGMAWVVPALVLLTALGCGHRRSSLRPVYTTPAPGCATGTVVPESSTTTSPASPTSSYLESKPGTYDEAATPASTVSPPRPMSPSGPGSSDEPGLNPELSPATPSTVPNLQSPARVPSKTGLRTPSGRVRQAGAGAGASLRERLTPFVNEPGDLFQPPKAERPWKYVVLHHSAKPSGSYDAIDREHRDALGWNGCGYHFIIGNGTGSADGRIEVSQRWVTQKHGIHSRDGKNPDVSEYGIGICLVGDLDDAPPTPRQIAAAKALVAYLSARYDIPIEKMGTHSHLAASPTACPGKLFPVQAILGSRSLAAVPR